MVASISFNLSLLCISGDVLLLCGGMGGGGFLLIIFVLKTGRGADSIGRALPYLAYAGMCR